MNSNRPAHSPFSTQYVNEVTCCPPHMKKHGKLSGCSQLEVLLEPALLHLLVGKLQPAAYLEALLCSQLERLLDQASLHVLSSRLQLAEGAIRGHSDL